MQSIDLLRGNLFRSTDRVLERVEDMREHCFVFPTPNGGGQNFYPPFDLVLAKCREMRKTTMDLLDRLSEEDLDEKSAHVPDGHEENFGTHRLCFQYIADHWYMHRGQLDDARRAADQNRMWL
ncbi:MAG: hypothetical protein ACI9UK_000974 [Candidatus Krumholzibacteriia bacterium]|jgi:hypothetical protein